MCHTLACLNSVSTFTCFFPPFLIRGNIACATRNGPRMFTVIMLRKSSTFLQRYVTYCYWLRQTQVLMAWIWCKISMIASSHLGCSYKNSYVLI